MIKSIFKYKWLILAVAALVALYVFDQSKGTLAVQFTLNNFKSVGLVLPPIFLMIGLLDTWVSRDLMVKLMGDRSGIIGGVIALFIGTVGAGPLYVAFPIAAVLIKKGARLAYVFLFLSAWVSVKLPIFMYEWASFGSNFTLLHVGSSLLVYVMGSVLMERLLSSETKADIQMRAEQMAA